MSIEREKKKRNCLKVIRSFVLVNGSYLSNDNFVFGLKRTSNEAKEQDRM